MAAPVSAALLQGIKRDLPNVERLEFQSGPDSEGQPATWIWVVFKAQAPKAAWAWDNRERIRSEIAAKLQEAGVTDWVYVRFRSGNEEIASVSARST